MEYKQGKQRLSEIHNNIPSMRLDEENLFKVLSEYGAYVHSRNTVECKRFIKEFIENVSVSCSHIEVVMRISSSIITGCTYTKSIRINRQFLPNPNKKTAG